ncbi:uncharacterized protein N7469_011172 [Penicillium citrinum]|uniref:PhoD-like phosphatase domain-containing protein n=1 Tax=Penicillium citrinum TaxID=5077 RepID=A0A9W9TCC7_PENCI|nr:uncharacterized protein N7469_011172 [Penicillium citrinum]KAJ5217547.1 hypothetical protein N7469_011172 [Penicillium citrinum]
MDPGDSRGIHPDGELFLNSSNRPNQNESLVEPLRINKRDSTSPASASSPSPAPLPYPDDRPRPQMRTASSNDGRPADMRYASSPPPTTSAGSVSGSGSGSGSVSPNDYPSALRPRDGREPRVATLAERRGAAPQPLPESPGAHAPDRDALAARTYPRPPAPAQSQSQSQSQSTSTTDQNQNQNQYDYRQQYYPPPQNQRPASLQPPQSTGINRISSTASTSTTRAQRGSPPPPETPIVEPGQQPSDIEARYAAAGIAGTSTLSGIQSQNAAAQRRADQYLGQQPTFQQTPRPWTPTEQPGSQPHGPPTVYQGAEVVSGGQGQGQHPVQHPGQYGSPPPQAQAASPPSQQQQYQQQQYQQQQYQQQQYQQQQYPQQQQPQNRIPNALEQDMDRMRISEEPPPAYSSVSGGASNGYPNEKPGAGASTGAGAGASGMAGHPATTHSPHPATAAAAAGATAATATPAVGTSASPAPSSSTQDHPAFANDPRQQQTMGQSPQSSAPNGHSAYQQATVAQIASPAPTGLPPASPPPLPEGWIAHMDPNSAFTVVILSHHLGYRPLESHWLPPGAPMTPGFESLQSPMTGFSGPPPSSGMDIYKTAPTNGVYFGPYLRYTNMDLERGLWLGSILLVTDAAQPPTIHCHQSVDLSPNPKQLKAINIAAHQRWTFYKYEIEIQMDDAGPAKWTYAITSHLGCTRYEFLVAGRHETNWRFISTSGNDFSLNVNANERARLGGVGFMWKDIMQKHNEIGGFHAQLCLGGQIYADRMWKEIPCLKQWLSISGKEARKNAPWTAANQQDVSHAYFHYYTSHFDQPYLRESFAQIPYICQIDDHDIFDGFGSYPEHMQFSNMFKNIGRIGIEMYLLFQHHTTLDILRNVNNDLDLFTITGTGWHFVKYLGPGVVVVGPDCRSERNPHQVMAGPTYQGLFPKVAMLPPSVQHCLWMLSMPLVYPRLETAEQIAQTVTTGKRAVTGAYNVLGKVTSSVAGVVGAKDFVGSGFDSVKRAVGKSGLMGGILSPFGEFDLMDELRDQWTHESKDFSTIHPNHPITKQCINLSLHQCHGKPLYVPANGHRSSAQPTDTKEDMMEIFQSDVNGQNREHRKLMARRNYVAVVAYDPDVAQGGIQGSGKLSLAADFMVQGDGAYANVVKYGPVIVPSLEQGR